MALNFPSNPADQTPTNTYSPTSTPYASTNGVTYTYQGGKWASFSESGEPSLPLTGGNLTGDLTIGTTKIALGVNGNAAFEGKIISASTTSGDAAETLATKDYVDSTSGSAGVTSVNGDTGEVVVTPDSIDALALAGGTMTGDIVFNAGQSFPGVLSLTGGAITGDVTYSSTTQNANNIQTKASVEALISNLSGGFTFKGDVDVTSTAPASPEGGDFYLSLAAGTVNASWTGIAGQSVLANQVVVYSESASRWFTGAVQDVTAYLLKSGGNMTGDLTLGTDKAVLSATTGNISLGPSKVTFDATAGTGVFDGSVITGGSLYVDSDSNYGLFKDGVSLKLKASSTTFDFVNSGQFLVPGQIQPKTDGDVDLGGSSYRWNNVYSEAGDFSGTVTVGGISSDGDLVTTGTVTGSEISSTNNIFATNNVLANGSGSFVGKVSSAATLASDPSTTLTTKSYVDSVDAKATQALSDSATALSTANSASSLATDANTTATTALNTANTAASDASTALTTANSALDYTNPATGAVQRTITSRLAERLSVKDFGAVGDGSTDDTTAIQDAVDAAIAITNSAPCTLEFPSGVYKITAPINFIASGGDRLTIIGGDGSFEGAEIVVAFHGSGTFWGGVYSAAFYFANQTGTPNGYMRAVSISGFLFKRASSSFGSPIGIEAYGWAQSRISHITFGSWSNACISLAKPQNLRSENVVTFSGGASYKSISNNVNVTGTGTRVDATFSVFKPEDVGKTFFAQSTSGGNNVKFKVLAYLSTTAVTQEKNYNFTARKLIGGAPYAAITSGSTTAVIETANGQNPITNSALNRPLWFKPTTGTDRTLFRARIVSRNGANVTLDTPAPFTSSKCLVVTPCMEIWDDPNIFGDISDCKFVNLQLENPTGVNLCIENASVMEFMNCKLHSEQTISLDTYTHAAFWGSQVDGYFYGSFDGQFVGDQRAYITSQTSTFTWGDVHSRSAYYDTIFGVGPRNSLFSGSVVNIGHINIVGAHPTSRFVDIIEDANTSKYGYHCVGTFSNQGNSVTSRNESLLGPGVTIENDDPSDNTAIFNLGRASIFTTSANPDGVISAPPGSLCLRFSTSGQGYLYLKQSGTGNTGWTAITP